MNYYQLQTPIQYRAGYSYKDGKQIPFHFDCADCRAKEPVIKGFLGSAPEFSAIAVKKLDSGFYDLCLFCAPCFDKRLAQANHETDPGANFGDPDEMRQEPEERRSHPFI